MSLDTRAVPLASPEQVDYAGKLGLDSVTESTPIDVARRLITEELRRRGRLALEQLKPKVDDECVHPTFGLCRISRVGRRTLKITLEPVAGGRKHVIDAAWLPEYTQKTRTGASMQAPAK